MGADVRHPCLSCGACCALETVQFHADEVRRRGGSVPTGLVEPAPVRDHVRMKQAGGRCTALDGVCGEAVLCGIYADRPSVCREFGASWESGTANPHCDDARQALGLAPLTLADFFQPVPGT